MAIVNAGEDDTEKIIHQVNKLNDKRIVVIYPENRFVQDKNIRKLLAVKQLIKMTGLLRIIRFYYQSLSYMKRI